MKRKIKELMEKPGFVENLAVFKNSISSNTSDSDMEFQLRRLFHSLPRKDTEGLNECQPAEAL